MPYHDIKPKIPDGNNQTTEGVSYNIVKNINIFVLVKEYMSIA